MEPRDALLYSHVIGFYPQILGKSLKIPKFSFRTIGKYFLFLKVTFSDFIKIEFVVSIAILILAEWQNGKGCGEFTTKQICISFG